MYLKREPVVLLERMSVSQRTGAVGLTSFRLIFYLICFAHMFRFA